MTFYAVREHHWAGTFLKPAEGAFGAVEEREVDVTTLDDLLARREWEGPFGLKVDVEGFEHEVIEGATELLKETQFVICEVWFAERRDQPHTFATFVALMADRGFRLTDILEGTKATPSGEILYVDALFQPSADR
jgi:Methyltransferase FkbM domain